MTLDSSLSLQERIYALEPLVNALRAQSEISEKLRLLAQESLVKAELQHLPLLQGFLKHVSLETQFVIHTLLAIGEASFIFYGIEKEPDWHECLSKLAEQLWNIEIFYDAIGGIVGYHVTVLKLIAQYKVSREIDSIRYLKPEGMDISLKTTEVNQAIHWGIESLPEMAEIYPVGGAGDRLALHC